MTKSQKGVAIAVSGVVLLIIFLVAGAFLYRWYRQYYPKYENGSMICGGMLRVSCPDYSMCYPIDASDPSSKGTCIPEYVDPPRREEKIYCGGVAGLECPDGYQCQYEDTDVVDAMGVCVPKSALYDNTNTSTANEQSLCAGPENLPCPSGYYCQQPADAPSESVGVCVPLAE